MSSIVVSLVHTSIAADVFCEPSHTDNMIDWHSTGPSSAASLACHSIKVGRLFSSRLIVTLISAVLMFDLLIYLVMLGIIVSLGAGLYFLVTDKGRTDRTVKSLTVRVALAVLLLILLAIGFISRYSQ